MFQAISWSGRAKLRRTREKVEVLGEKDWGTERPPLVVVRSRLFFSFFFNPACSVFLCLRTESLEQAIRFEQKLDLSTRSVPIYLIFNISYR